MKKFSENQVFTNFLKTHPQIRADFHNGGACYNENINQGAQVLSGTLSLYEYNVNREDDSLIFPFITKDAAKNSFTVTTNSTYNALNIGATIAGTYPLTSSISRQYPMSTTYKSALKTSLNHYKYLSPYYNYSYYESAGVNLISIPSIFFGETIKKGSVRLSCHFTGVLVAQARDIGYNGALIQTFGTAPASGTTIGTVLYNEGFLLLTSSYDLSTTATDTWDGSSTAPKWTLFGPYDGATPPDSGSWTLEFEGTNTVPVMTMLAEAGKNEFNYSNNKTFISSGTIKREITSRNSFVQASGSMIQNIAKSDYTNASEPFEPITYVSKIGIYDERKNLIAIAKLARPVKKNEQDGYTFKISIDL
tara:strand:- start:92 stop:1180 length:1089 start_codon:yes stop_codon:yes gene_type:complete